MGHVPNVQKSLEASSLRYGRATHGPQAVNEHIRQKTVTLSLKALLADESGQL
jgi:hypothetical protein